MTSTQKPAEYGSIEGLLVNDSVLAGEDKIVIVDALTGHKTRCYVKGEELENKVRSLRKRRVAVTGKITVDRSSGRPAEMQVDNIHVLRSRESLPQLDDLHGIDITGGMESSEYVGKLRDGE